MNKPAYDVEYLESMKRKTRYLFKLIARNCEDVFGTIEKYMRSTYRKYMDMGNPLYLNKTPKQILGSMNIKVDLHAEISEKYDEFRLEWMADIYTYLQWNFGLWSADIVGKILPEDLYRKYNPLHETSLKNGAWKLKEIYGL
ncbi:MAG: hypothetical protein Q4C91_21435 [Eubacteriales bacterium]|nr:hypothetical protein [Eubacteriales bacterium]